MVDFATRRIPPAGTAYTAVAAGSWDLGLLTNGTIDQWNDALGLPPTPPPGIRYSAIAIGGSPHGLGLLSNGTIVAWGLPDIYGDMNVPPPPPGKIYSAIAAGGSYFDLGLLIAIIPPQ